MALDAIIAKVDTSTVDAVLTLQPRESYNYMSAGDVAYSPESSPGQSKMTIVNPSFIPHVGDEIWGGSDSEIIESGGFSFPYQRDGYTRLKQNW